MIRVILSFKTYEEQFENFKFKNLEVVILNLIYYWKITYTFLKNILKKKKIFI